MRKLFRSILDLTLIQQLAIIIVSVAAIFILFFTVYLKNNIDTFVNEQVMSILRRSQQTVARIVLEDIPDYSELSYEMEISHFIYKNNQLITQYPEDVQPSFDLLNDLKDIALKHVDDSQPQEGYIKVDENYYFRISSADNRTEIISVVDESYGRSIENTLLNSVSNSSAIVYAIIFVILLVWATSIISPLQLMKSYIENVKNGHADATLNVERGDEIGELAKALVELNAKVKSEEDAKEEMIHNISHDLKTPIATIKSYAESIHDGIYPYGTLESSVDVIVENAERLEKKVYSLLYLNRVDYIVTSQKDMDIITNMSETTRDVLMSLRLIRPEVRFETYIDDNVFFKGDDESWRVVISNLVDNALRYAVRGICITLKPYSFSISNDGEPLSEDRVQKLFKPFEKGDKGKFGLGLSICYKVCNAYGYDIVAENLESGVIFRIDAKEKPSEKDKVKIIKKEKKNIVEKARKGANKK